MSGNVLYLNAWLDCPDLILRRNYAMQDKINEARNYVFYKLKQEGKTEGEARYCYLAWVKKNRSKLRIIE
jgi:hypothetical protein